MFLTDKYFQGELYLPHLKYNTGVGDATGYDRVTQISADSTLEYFIDKYEVQFLRLLLGRDLAASFIDGMAETDIDPIWSALKDEIYKQVGKSYFSPAANYVYFYAKRDSRTTSTVKGEARDKQDYAEITSDVNKLNKAWNDINPQVEDIYCFLRKNWITYKQYSSSTCFRWKMRYINQFGI